MKYFPRTIGNRAAVLSVCMGLATVLATGTSANAKDIVVQMKNAGTGASMVFEPDFVQAAIGDTIHFMPTDPGHNAETIEGMLPFGVQPSAGEINKEFDLTVTSAGLYGIKCKPHFSHGMVALIKVGDGPSPNATDAAAVKLPPFAAKRMSQLLKQVD